MLLVGPILAEGIEDCEGFRLDDVGVILIEGAIEGPCEGLIEGCAETEGAMEIDGDKVGMQSEAQNGPGGELSSRGA